MSNTARRCQILNGLNKQIKQFDGLALEDHSYVATPEERSRYKNSWKVSQNREGIQGQIKQRPDILLKQSTNA